MALDFPANPIDGQVFGSYVWLASKSVWQAREESATVAITSPVAPATANNGDIWYNTNRGIAYVYYDDGSSSQWVEIVTSGVPSLEEVMPTGSVIQTARATAPTGWALCDGSSLLVANYQKLFNAIGYSYGGSGANFNLPNLKGRVPVGMDASQTEFDSLGETGGAKTHTLSINEMPSHTHIQDSHNHTQNAHSHTITSVYDDANYNQGTIPQNNQQSIPFDAGSITRTQTTNSTTATNNATTATNQNTGGGLAHNNLQPYIVMNYIIKV